MSSDNNFIFLQAGGYGDVFVHNGLAFKFYHHPGIEKKEFSIVESIRNQISVSGREFKHLLSQYEATYIPKETVTKVYSLNFSGHPEPLKKIEMNYKRYNKVPCLQTNYVEGLDGISFHEKHGLLNEPLAIHLMILTLEALEEFHSLGYLHRDVKPENFIINERVIDGRSVYEVTLIDYGLASSMKSLTPNGYIEDRRLADINHQWHIDTTAYKAGRYYVSSELYSVGVMFMGFTGCRLRYHSKFMELLRKITSNDFVQRGSLEDALSCLRDFQFELSTPIVSRTISTRSMSSKSFSWTHDNDDKIEAVEEKNANEKSFLDLLLDGMAGLAVAFEG